MTAYWCEYAWLGGEAVETGVLLEVDGDTLATVTSGASTVLAAATRLRGLTLPGLANAHSHAFHRALRGRGPTEGPRHVLDLA